MREAREPNTLENLKAKIAAGLAKIPVNISREQNLNLLTERVNRLERFKQEEGVKFKIIMGACLVSVAMGIPLSRNPDPIFRLIGEAATSVGGVFALLELVEFFCAREKFSERLTNLNNRADVALTDLDPTGIE